MKYIHTYVRVCTNLPSNFDKNEVIIEVSYNSDRI